MRLRRFSCGVLAVAALATAAGAVNGSAASLGVGTAKLTAWQSASSVTGCTGPGTQTLVAVADTYVGQDAPTTNFGTQSVTRVRSLISSNQRALVRFALPALPANCTVTAATLRLNATSASTGRTLQVLRAAGTWGETTANWNNQPATAGTAVTAGSGTGWREWTVTAHVTAIYAGTNNGFLVRDSVEGGLSQLTSVFNSREAASNAPELVVTLG